MNELIQKSASDLASLIQSKEVSSKEVVKAHLDRIQEVNPEIYAVTIVPVSYTHLTLPTKA